MLRATGELDRSDVPSLRAALQQAFAETDADVILDLSDVSYLDSSVLAVLISEAVDARARGGTLAVVTGPAGIMRSLEMKGLTEILQLSETVDDAIASLA